MARDESELDILDEQIKSLQDMASDKQLDFDERMKVTNALLKALSMRHKLKNNRKGKGFDLSR